MKKERNKYKPSLVDLGIFLCGVLAGFLIGFPWNWFLRDIPEANAAETVTRTTYSYYVSPTVAIVGKNNSTIRLGGRIIPFEVVYHQDTNRFEIVDGVYYMDNVGVFSKQNIVIPSSSGGISSQAISANCSTYVNQVTANNVTFNRIMLVTSVSGTNAETASVSVELYRAPASQYDFVQYGFDSGNGLQDSQNLFLASPNSYGTLQAQYDAGYNAGEKQGFDQGYRRGRNDGAADANEYTFMNLLNSVFYAPIHALYSLLNFEIFGVNVYSVVTGLMSAFVVIGLVMFVLKVVK